MMTLTSVAGAAEPPPLDYAAVDNGVRVVLLDSSETESFLAVQADPSGRLFVGGREALFVYEPDGHGGYHPRRELARFPEHTWIYDIALRGNDVYALTVSALYVIPNAVVQRENLVPQRLVWGVPLGHVHQCFHGMAIGPEGDIYFAMGDPLWYYGDFNRPDHWGHWTFFSQPDGTKTPYNGVGGVFRCRPDGSGFRIVARGLRNSCGLAFDRHYNLFTNDNDHESMPAEYVPGRLIHVVPGGYYNWPRGWLAGKQPDRYDLLETMIDNLGRAVPVGQAYYDDTYLPAEYRNNLLVARWCNRAVTRYPLTPRGASFTTREAVLVQGRDLARPVGVSVGLGGRVLFTVAYMAQNEGSPVYRSDLALLTRADDTPEHRFAAYDVTAVDDERLWSELSQADFSRRQVAHTELLRRGGASLASAVDRLAGLQGGDPAGVHLVWLAAASGAPRAAALIDQLAAGNDRALARAAWRVLSEYPALGADAARFLAALGSPDPQIQHAGLVGLFAAGTPDWQAVLAGPAVSEDSYLRQAAALLLAEQATPALLEELCRDKNHRRRLAGVLAIGFRLTLPPATGVLPADAPLDKLRAEDNYIIEFIDGRVDLRDHGRVGNYTTADHWNKLPRDSQQEMLFAVLLERLADPDEAVRLQSAHFLHMLNDQRSEALVAQVRTTTEEQRLSVARLEVVPRVWLLGPLDDSGSGFQTVHPPETGPLDLHAEYDGLAGKTGWKQATGRFINFIEQLGPMPGASVYTVFRLESPARQPIQMLVGSDDGVRVWHNGRLVHDHDIVRGALPLQDVVPLTLQPGSNEFLVRVRNHEGASGVYLAYRALGTVVASLPDKTKIESLADRLASAGAGAPVVGPEFLSVDWRQAARDGDAEQGRKLFEAVGCAKCHAVSPEATVVGGPSLADAARRFTIDQLVESVLMPGKQISPVFRATQIQTTDGRQHLGLVVGETSDAVELLLPDTKRITLAKADIEERQLVDTSPMPQGVVKKPDELKHLLAYLLSQ